MSARAPTQEEVAREHDRTLDSAYGWRPQVPKPPVADWQVCVVCWSLVYPGKFNEHYAELHPQFEIIDWRSADAPGPHGEGQDEEGTQGEERLP